MPTKEGLGPNKGPSGGSYQNEANSLVEGEGVRASGNEAEMMTGTMMSYMPIEDSPHSSELGVPNMRGDNEPQEGEGDNTPGKFAGGNVMGGNPSES